MASPSRTGWALAALLVATLVTVPGCRKKLAEGTCRTDNDCKAGWDCKASLCVEREKPPWEQAKTATPGKASAPATNPATGQPWPEGQAPATPRRGAVFVPPDQKVTHPVPPPPGQPYRPQPVRRGPRYFPLDT